MSATFGSNDQVSGRWAIAAAPVGAPPWRSWRVCGSAALFYAAVGAMVALAFLCAGAP